MALKVATVPGKIKWYGTTCRPRSDRGLDGQVGQFSPTNCKGISILCGQSGRRGLDGLTPVWITSARSLIFVPYCTYRPRGLRKRGAATDVHGASGFKVGRSLSTDSGAVDFSSSKPSVRSTSSSVRIKTRDDPQKPGEHRSGCKFG